MKQFMDEDFLLKTKTAQALYHDFAKTLPIIDYHCHLPPREIAEDRSFEDLTEIWLSGDHYKWRAMRAHGIAEDYITGGRSHWEKFQQWAETVPYTVRNPLYHWTHLELRRYFGEEKLLSPTTAAQIYDRCTEKLQLPEFSVKNLISRMHVEVLCTTDDPVDGLEHHRQINSDGFGTRVLPAFRPDAAMNLAHPSVFNTYVDRLEGAANCSISSFDGYVQALKSRHDYFALHGCSVSDHGLEQVYAEDYSDAEIKKIFQKVRAGKSPDDTEIKKFISALLVLFAEWGHEKGWVQQFHLGALRNNNSRMFARIGSDTGWDSIGDFSQARSLAKFLDRLDRQDKLAKTIIYNLNPSDNEAMASMIGNFNDGSVAGKIQWGAAWWFLDQQDGMTRQLNALSSIGLLSRFVGMLTDSRSFLSYPRHEYFRRILCNLFGEDIENGELPADLPWMGKIIQDICYHNAKKYFMFKSL